MATPDTGLLSRLPLTLRAIVGGLLIGMIAANVWPLLILRLSAPVAAAIEVVFLGLYFLWASGAGPPAGLRENRRDFARANPLTARQWVWGLIAAVAFATTVHAAIVVLFRLVPFPAAAFHAGYDFSFIPTMPFKWLACVVSALSAGVCEEMGFRGYMQRPIENRHGPWLAIAISALMFTLIHLNKSWALMAMTPIVLGAGVMLGVLARRSASLVFCIIGHTLMDIGLFAYWWTQIAGTFPQRPISETGLEPTFYVEAAVLAVAFLVFVIAAARVKVRPVG
jgi:membrane protease YdiL (CAAX protease family)